MEEVRQQRINSRAKHPAPRRPPAPQANAVASTSRQPLPDAQGAKVSGLPAADTKSTGLMSPPSTQASTASIVSAVTERWPEVGVALGQNPRRKKRQSAKPYVEREHIHAKEASFSVDAPKPHVSADGWCSTRRACRRSRSSFERSSTRRCRNSTTSSGLQVRLFALYGMKSTYSVCHRLRIQHGRLPKLVSHTHIVYHPHLMFRRSPELPGSVGEVGSAWGVLTYVYLDFPSLLGLIPVVASPSLVDLRAKARYDEDRRHSDPGVRGLHGCRPALRLNGSYRSSPPTSCNVRFERHKRH